nr:GGDEF domain protein [uncultured Mediterranean phage uvMED]
MPRVPNTANITNPKRKGYDLALDDLLFRTAIAPDRQMTISTAEFPGQEINLKQNPEDITTNIGQIYSRSDFSGGQGLDTAHKRNLDEKSITRYFDSKGVDVFHADDESSYHVNLLYQTQDENVRGSDTVFAGTNNYLVQTTNGDLYVTDQTNIYKSTNDGDTWAAVSTGLTINYNFTGLVAVGNKLYATTADGTSNSELIEFDGSSWHERTTAQSSSGGLNGVWFAKGQLIIAGNDGTVVRVWAITPFNQTWDSSDLQDAQAIITFDTSYHVSQVADAGAVILVAGTDGNVYSLKDVSGTMTLFGQTNIAFEEVHSIAASEGIIFIGTKDASKSVGRFYTAQLVAQDNLYVLANRQLIKEWEISGQDTTPKYMFVSRDSVYMGIKESGTESYLWRYYLPTAGLARDLKMSASGFITGITSSNGKFVIAVSGKDIYRETSTFETTGYIILPNADFFTSEDKQWVGVEVEHDSLSEGKTVKIFVSTTYDTIDDPDSSNWELVGSSVAGTGNVEYQLNRNARYINAKIVIEPNVTSTESPEFRTISIRALPRPELVVVTVPINLSDQVERPNRKSFKVKNLGEVVYQTLKQKEGDSVTLQLYEPSEIIRGVVEFVQYPVFEKSEVGSVTQFCLLRVRGVRAEDAATTVTRLLGVGQLGVAGLG